MATMIDSETSDLAWIKSSSSLTAFILVEASVYGPPYKKDQVTFFFTFEDSQKEE
jgi:hypothetical protein